MGIRICRRLICLAATLLVIGLPVVAEDEWYSVQIGDSIASIAAHFGVSPQILAERNRLDAGDQLTRGQILRIPVVVQSPLMHVVTATDSLLSIAARYGVTVEALMAENNILRETHLIPGQMLYLPAVATDSFPTTHIVRAGESLQKIAERYGITWRALATVNNIANPNRIRVGQVLLVPDAEQIVAPKPDEGLSVQLEAPVVHRVYVARPGDTLASIAERYAVPLDDLRAINHIRGETRLYGGDVLLIPPGNIADGQFETASAADEIRHVVRYGETLGTIAAQYGRDMWDIAAANGLLNPNRIYVGQVLIIR